jgi:hypothetical protein
MDHAARRPRRAWLRGLALLAVPAMLACSACRPRGGWAAAAGGVYLPDFVGREEVTLHAAVTRQLGLASDADLGAQGLEIQVRDRLVDTIFIHLLPDRGGGSVYRGPLFGGLAPTMRRPDVEKLLGPPDVTSQPGDTPMFPAVSASWIKYNRAEAQIHFDFTSDTGPIRMITLMRPDWKPGDP